MFYIGYFVIYLPRKTQFICTSGFQPSSAFYPVFQLVDWGIRRSDGFLEVSVVIVSAGIIPKLYPLLNHLATPLLTSLSTLLAVMELTANVIFFVLWFCLYWNTVTFMSSETWHLFTTWFPFTLNRHNFLWWISFLDSKCVLVSQVQG